MEIKLLGKKILIKLNEVEKQIDGFELVQHNDVDQTAGVVANVGMGVSEVKVGDKVIVNKFSGIEVLIEGDKFKVVEEHEILIIVR
jgi:co-chaperonin GroES (HSP10)